MKKLLLFIGGITLFYLPHLLLLLYQKKNIKKNIKLAAPIKKIIKVISKKFILFLFIKKKGLKLDLSINTISCSKKKYNTIYLNFLKIILKGIEPFFNNLLLIDKFTINL